MYTRMHALMHGTDIPRTDERSNGHMGGHTEGWTTGWTHGRTHRGMDNWMDVPEVKEIAAPVGVAEEEAAGVDAERMVLDTSTVP